MEREILTIKQAADFLQIHERTVYNLAKKKNIPSFKIGSDWRFLKKDIENWIEQKKKEIAGELKTNKIQEAVI